MVFRIGFIPLACVFALCVGTAQAQQPPAAPASPPAAPASPPAAPASPPAAAPAASASASPSVLVVDVQSLLQNSKAAKMVRSQIDAKRAEYAKQISHQEEQLRKERDTLQRQQASLSQEALNAKGREFQLKVNDLDRTVQSKRQALEKSNSEALEKIQQSMLKIINTIAKERKANLVFQRAELVLFDQQYDVTDQVLQKLDEEMPTLTVTFVQPVPVTPTPAPAPAAKPKKR